MSLDSKIVQQSLKSGVVDVDIWVTAFSGDTSFSNVKTWMSKASKVLRLLTRLIFPAV